MNKTKVFTQFLRIKKYFHLIENSGNVVRNVLNKRMSTKIISVLTIKCRIVSKFVLTIHVYYKIIVN